MVSNAYDYVLRSRIPGNRWIRPTLTPQYLAQLTFIFAAYLAAGLAGLSVPFTSGNVSPVWPASGVALAGMLVAGYRIWPAVMAGAFFVNFLTAVPLGAALGIAAGNTAAALTGAALLREYSGFRISMRRLRDVVGLISFGALGASAVSATVGCITLSFTSASPWSGFATSWLIWYLGDAMGVLLLAPLALTAPGLLPLRQSGQSLRFAGLLAGTAITSLLIFDNRFGPLVSEDLFAFAVFPFVIWGAIQFRSAGVAVVTFLISLVVVVETYYGSGPFAKSNTLHNAALLQCFLAIISISGMTLAAVSSERLKAIRDQETRKRKERSRLASLEMEIARQVQTNLLPKRVPVLTTLEYSACSMQARAVGGDYYDYLDLGSDRVAFILADVSGKGICAALMMGVLQGELRSQSAIMGEDVARSLRFVNRLFYESTEDCHFATLFVGVYDDPRRKLTYVNCGHNPPLLLHGDKVEQLPATATVLGLFEKWDCEVQEITLSPGDVLTLYTDGVVEAVDENHQEFGLDRLAEILLESKYSGPASLITDVILRVEEFVAGEQGDDITVLAAVVR